MKLSVPLYRLKRQAKMLARSKGLRLHQALDQIATAQGFASWSLLAAQQSRASPAKKLLAVFEPGEMVLVGARPGQGKTRLSLEIAVEAMLGGNPAVFFSLEYGAADLFDLFVSIDRKLSDFRELFEFDTSDSICAEYIIDRLSDSPPATVVVVDYLQLLDQKRSTPGLEDQIIALKSFAETRKMIMLFISQIDRRFDMTDRSCPGLDDVRLPNPLNLNLFSRSCFLNNGELYLSRT